MPMNRLEYKKLGLTYTVTQTFTAGIELLGFEVKSLKTGLGSLDGSKVIVRGGEAYAVGIYIPPFQPANTPAGYDNNRTRRLLLTKDEIRELSHLEQTKGLTIIPSVVYTHNNLIKCEIAVCKKKQASDKRESIKQEISRRELRAH